MSGTCVVIQGDIADWRLKPVAKPRTLVDRMLFRTRYEGIQDIAGPDRRYITIYANRLSQPLYAAFCDFVTRTVQSPHSETNHVIEYLRSNRAFIRNDDANNSESSWYLQINFSGCAGMAETTAELAYHWCEIWLTNDFDRVKDEILIQEGFTPRELPAFDDLRCTFMPIRNHGYASCIKKRGSFNKAVSFCLDTSGWFDGDDDELGGLYERIEDKYGNLMLDGICRCQMCIPEFEPVELPG